MKKKILILVLLLVLAGAAVGYYLYQEQTPDLVNRSAEVSVTANALIAEFDKDSAAARRKYIGKIVEVSGTVIKADTSGSVVMGEAGSPSEVVFGIDRRHIEELAALKPGQPAVLQGRCTDFEKSSGDDLLASLGLKVEISAAGVKKNK